MAKPNVDKIIKDVQLLSKRMRSREEVADELLGKLGTVQSQLEAMRQVRPIFYDMHNDCKAITFPHTYVRMIDALEFFLSVNLVLVDCPHPEKLLIPLSLKIGYRILVSLFLEMCLALDEIFTTSLCHFYTTASPS